MTAKCANPSCSVPFNRLGRGRLFRFEVRSPSRALQGHPGHSLQHEVGPCFSVFLVVREVQLDHNSELQLRKRISRPTDTGSS